MIRSDTYVEFDTLTQKVSKGVQLISEKTWVVELEDIEKESGRLLNQRFESEISSTKSVFTSEDILYSKLRPYLKKYLLPHSNGICTSELWVLRPDKKIPREYLFYLIQSPFFTRLTGVSSGSKMPRANWNYVKQSDVPLHSDENERLKIGTIFNQIDQKINLLTKKKEALETYKKGLMQKIFSQELRFKREDGTDYAEWELVRFESILIPRSERNKRSELTEVYSVSNKDGFISQTKQFDGYSVASNDVSNYKLVYPNDIVYNPSRINVGSIAVNETDGIKIVSPLYNIFSVDGGYNSSFWFILTELHYFKHLVNISCSGSVRDSLSLDDLMSFNMILPSVDEAKKIELFLSKYDRKIFTLVRQLEVFKEFKKGLLQQMFV